MIMYIGPELEGITRANQIFNYEPEAIKAAAEKVEPLSRYLFVDLDNIVSAKKELHTKGSLLFLAYEKTIKTISKEE